jgi:hypothetical protein
MAPGGNGGVKDPCEPGAHQIMGDIVNEGGVAAKKESRWLLTSGLRCSGVPTAPKVGTGGGLLADSTLGAAIPQLRG